MSGQTMTAAPRQADTAAWDRAEAILLATEACGRFADLVQRVSADDWQRPTDCDGWDVRDLVGHMVGAMRAAASVRELLSQQREIQRRHADSGEPETDIMTQVQIERTSDLTTTELARECLALVEPAGAGRARTPRFLRRWVRFPVRMGTAIDETWTLGYLVDMILTRDAWLHRIDLARALHVEPVLTADHDGRIVLDVVREWADRHGESFELVLDGPAGGRFSSSATPNGSPLHLDGVEFCRIVSGRAVGDGMLETAVPF